MFRASFVTAGVVAAAFAMASPAMADPPVPGMKTDAVLGEPCYNTSRFIFGTNASGAILACGAPGKPGQWVQIAGVIGVRTIGTPCHSDVVSVNPRGAGWTAAQSPEGVPLVCSYPTDTWEVNPTPTA
jgi:hypothetical protein